MRLALAFVMLLATVACANVDHTKVSDREQRARQWASVVSSRYDLPALMAFVRDSAAQQRAPDGGALPTEAPDAK